MNSAGSAVGPNGKVEIVSIIMPTYNRLAYLKEAVASVMEQTWTDWELVISDDGSTDGTREYLKSLTDPRIKVFLQPSHLGQFGQFNFLIERSSSSLIQILCDDDRFIDNTSLERVVRVWESLPQEVAFMRANHTLDANSKLSRFEKKILPLVVFPEQSDLLLGVFGCIPGNITNIFFRAPRVRELGLFRAEMFYAGDFELWARLGRVYPWAITQEKVAWMREHPGQVTATMNKYGEAVMQLRIVIESIFDHLVKQGYSARALRLMFTINYISRHRYIGVRRLLLQRDAAYLKVVWEKFDSANFSVSWWLRWPVFFLSAGGRLGRVALAKRLLRMKPKGRPAKPVIAAGSLS